jgi:hypothetical protein
VAFDVRGFLSDASTVLAGKDISFVDELPSEDEKARTCDVKIEG